MVQKNGYFDVGYFGDGAICHVHPPKEGGRLVEYRDLTSYLDAHGFSYDNKKLNTAIFCPDGGDVDIIPSSRFEFAESLFVEVSGDKMSAVARFYPASKHGNKLTVKDIMAALNQKGVIFGINQDAIMDFMDFPAYCQDVVLANGTLPEDGHDAYIEYFFNTDPNTRPAYNEDGSVDFHNLDVIAQVNEGQLLAKLHPEDKGKTGRNVLGQESFPRNVKSTFLQVGRNIRLNEERTEAFSEVTGHAKIYNGQIFVSDVYEVPADVDNSTGDIQYNGNVLIKGSIREGFSVNAKGDVVVEGTVEGALIVAGGEIIIKRGVNGMNKGILQAHGNIISKFIENAKAIAGGYIDTGSIIHSNVSAKGDVVVKDKKGFITGSVVKAGGKVEAQTIGSSMGSATRIEIGIDPVIKDRYQNLDVEIKKINLENQKITPIVQNYKSDIQNGIELDPKNKEYYIKLKQMLITNKQDLEKKMEEFRDLKAQIELATDSKVVVSRDIFPGVTVTCSDISYTTNDKRSYCYLERNNGEIVIHNL